jgi:hypothetical protein
MGAWGVFSGFMVFIFLWTHGRTNPRFFIASLFAAALIAYLAELLRDLIKEGMAMPALTGPRVVVTMLLLTIIELVVHAGTEMVQLGGDMREVASTHSEINEILGPLIGSGPDVMTEAIALALAWIVVGGIVGWYLSRIVFLQLKGDRVGILRGAREGVLGALIAAPICAVASQLLGRGFNLIRDLVLRHDAAADELRSSLGDIGKERLWIILLKLPTYLWLGAYKLAALGHGAGGLVLFALVGLAVFSGWRHRALLWVRIAAVAVPLLLLAPLPVDLYSLLEVALLAILIWVVPGFILGVATPLLRGAGNEPRLWGLIAFAAAALLSVLTLLKLTNPWCYALAVSLVLIGMLFFRGASLREYWPLAAAAMASMVSGVMVIVEKATFLGVVSEAQDVYKLPLYRPDELTASMKALTDSLFQEHIYDTPEFRDLTSQAQKFADMSVSRQVENLAQIKDLIARTRVWTRKAQSGYLRDIADGRTGASVAPETDIGNFYRILAQLELNPPPRSKRAAIYSDLLAQSDRLIHDEELFQAAQWRWRAGVTNTEPEMRQLLTQKVMATDTARFGLKLGVLVADLYRFSVLPVESRGQKGVQLRDRLEALMREQKMSLPGEESDAPEEFHLPSFGETAATPASATLPIDARLTQLWNQLAKELQSPGTGGFRPAVNFTGDKTQLSWNSFLGTEATGGIPEPFGTTRLTWLKIVQAEIRSQRAALVEEENAASLAGAGKPGVTGTHEGRAAYTKENENALASSSVYGAELVSLHRIGDLLDNAQDSALALKQAWTAPAAVTLELSLVGSFGFWVTVGLLAAWSLTEPRHHEESHS